MTNVIFRLVRLDSVYKLGFVAEEDTVQGVQNRTRDRIRPRTGTGSTACRRQDGGRNIFEPVRADRSYWASRLRTRVNE